MAENGKQEIELVLGEHTYRVRPDFETLANIEAATNQSARELGMKALAASFPPDQRGGYHEISLTELTQAIFTMLRDKKDGPKTAREVGNILMEHGYSKLLAPVGMFLTRAQRGNIEHEKEAAQEVAQSDPLGPKSE